MTTAHDRLDQIASTPAAEKRDEDAKPQDRASDNGLKIERSRRPAPDLDQDKEVPLHKRDDAPDGSTEESLLKYENGVPVRVSGPTHYAHLANGEIVGSYGVGTHVDNGDGPIPVVAHYAG